MWLQWNTFVVKSIKASSSVYLKSFILQGNSCLENCFSYKCENKNHPKAIYVQTFPTHPTTVYTKYENGTCSEFSKSNFIFILLWYTYTYMIILYKRHYANTKIFIHPSKHIRTYTIDTIHSVHWICHAINPSSNIYLKDLSIVEKYSWICESIS